MITILNSLNECIRNITTAIVETRTALYAEANARKTALQKAILDMNEANTVMTEFVNSTSALAEVLDDSAEDMCVSTEHITEMLSDMNVYSSNVEEFDGYCDRCGKELGRDEEQYMDEDMEGWVCTDCERILTAETETEAPVEQLTIVREEEA